MGDTAWKRDWRVRAERRGPYVEAPDLPAGVGWCEAVVLPSDGGPKRHCYTASRYLRDGREVCGLHLRRVEFGPPRARECENDAVCWQREGDEWMQACETHQVQIDGTVPTADKI